VNWLFHLNPGSIRFDTIDFQSNFFANDALRSQSTHKQAFSSDPPPAERALGPNRLQNIHLRTKVVQKVQIIPPHLRSGGASGRREIQKTRLQGPAAPNLGEITVLTA
jgi:hypothetical protein